MPGRRLRFCRLISPTWTSARTSALNCRRHRRRRICGRAKAEAEKRRAMAVAREQEMRALVVENEAKVPLAIAEAFQKGNLGIMDYYRMKNINADTSMRESISKVDKK